MTFAPKPLLDLQAYWRAQKGVSLGIVGDTSHVAKGVSYHLGRSQLTATAYSRRTARDRAGLTEAAAAIDLGKLNGNLTNLRKFSRWFAEQCLHSKPAYNDVREVIWFDIATGHVMGWSDLSPKAYIKDYGDSSHNTHTHISFYRDSEHRDKTAMFKPYFAPPPQPTPPQGDMPMLSSSQPGYSAVVKVTSNVREGPHLTSVVLRHLATEEHWAVIGMVKGDVDPEGGSDQWYVRWFNDRWEYTAFSNVPVKPTPPAPAGALDACNKSLATMKTDLAACNMKVSNAKVALG